jgi:hypothetical protein
MIGDSPIWFRFGNMHEMRALHLFLMTPTYLVGECCKGLIWLKAELHLLISEYLGEQSAVKDKVCQHKESLAQFDKVSIERDLLFNLVHYL